MTSTRPLGSRRAFLHPVASIALICALAAGRISEARAQPIPGASPGAEASVTHKGRNSFVPAHWSLLTAGLTMGPELGINLQIGTWVGRHVKVTILESRLGWSPLPPMTMDWHVGPTIGFGGHHGARGQFSHWLITGAWLGGRHKHGLFQGASSLTGLFVPLGYEFRHRFRPAKPLVWGFRVFAAYSPLYHSWVEGTSCDDDPDTWDLFCGPGDPIKLPLMTGVMFFIGFG